MTSDPTPGGNGSPPGNAPPAAQGTCAADGEFVVVDLAHELRTSLAIVTLLSGNLDLLYARLSERERKQMIQDIRRHTQRLNDLIGELLRLRNVKSPLPLRADARTDRPRFARSTHTTE